jgi:hypothetical protein
MLAILAAAVLIVLVGCSRLPVQEIDLTGTTWRLATIDGRPVETSAAPSIAFDSLDRATLRLGTCFWAQAGVIVDTDGHGLGFLEPIIYSPDPCPEVTEEGRSNVETVLHTGSWSVLDERTIELVGDYRLVFNQAS